LKGLFGRQRPESHHVPGTRVIRFRIMIRARIVRARVTPTEGQTLQRPRWWIVVGRRFRLCGIVRSSSAFVALLTLLVRGEFAPAFFDDLWGSALRWSARIGSLGAPFQILRLYFIFIGAG
jgi:hypothetical protein